MSRLGLAAAIVLTSITALPAVSTAQCDGSGSGDICASGSAWYGFTRLRIEPRDGSMPATTTSVHSPQDFSVEFGTGRAKGPRGRLLVIGGRALLMRDVPDVEPGDEIDVLDGLVLMNQLVVTLLDQAFPAGPDSVPAQHRVRVDQKTRAIRIATASAEGYFEAPWQLTGTVTRRDGRIEYDLRFAERSEDDPFSLDAKGFWVKDPATPPIDEGMPLDGWAIHWLGPMVTTDAAGTTFDYAAKPAAGRWKDVAALRKWISEHP